MHANSTQVYLNLMTLYNTSHLQRLHYPRFHTPLADQSIFPLARGWYLIGQIRVLATAKLWLLVFSKEKIIKTHKRNLRANFQ